MLVPVEIPPKQNPRNCHHQVEKKNDSFANWNWDMGVGPQDINLFDGPSWDPDFSKNPSQVSAETGFAPFCCRNCPEERNSARRNAKS